MAQAVSVRKRDGFDALVRMWQTGNENQKRWMRQNLDETGLDYRWLDEPSPWNAGPSADLS